MKKILFSIFIFTVLIEVADAQTFVTPLQDYIYTAFPFLRVSPDASLSGIGESGVAVLNPNNIYSNGAANSFMENSAGLALDYKQSGNKIGCITGYYKPNQNESFSGGMRYNSLGSYSIPLPSGSAIPSTTNFELTLDAGFARMLGDKTGMGLTLRYIYSNLSNGAIINGVEMQPVDDIAGDISIFYRNPIQFNGHPGHFNFGLNITNIGPKVQYGNPDQKLFLPTNLDLGIAIESKLDSLNNILFAFDLNKLLVPTLSITDEKGFMAAMHSFNDAPNGMQEELHEITLGTGLVYSYDERLFLRAGYYYEHPTKGGRTYYSLGAGISFQHAQLNVAYHFYNNSVALVVANMLSVTLSVELGTVAQIIKDPGL